MTRVMIIPAAGAGSRLKTSLPKLLVPVAGKPMIEHLFALYGGYVTRFALIVQPSAEALVRERYASRDDVDVYVQPTPTGMLDALLIPHADVARRGPNSVWITWCDQIAVHPATIARLASLMSESPDAALVMPTVRMSSPYTHLARDGSGRIVAALQRREEDDMPAEGDADSGLFGLRAETYLERLPEYALAPESGVRTGERNFLPFIPWLHARAAVVTFPSHESIECVGVNTPDELRAVEAHLRARAASGAEPSSWTARGGASR